MPSKKSALQRRLDRRKEQHEKTTKQRNEFAASNTKFLSPNNRRESLFSPFSNGAGGAPVGDLLNTAVNAQRQQIAALTEDQKTRDRINATDDLSESTVQGIRQQVAALTGNEEYAFPAQSLAHLRNPRTPEEQAEAWLIQKESGGRTDADNPTSTAFGIGQLLLANRKSYGAQYGFDPDTTDPYEQYLMFQDYVKARYNGSYIEAMNFHRANGWY